MLDSFFFARHLEDDEHVTRIVHRHWMIGLKELIVPFLFFVFPFFVLVLSKPSSSILIIFGSWAVLSFVWLARNFFDYYLDAWIITDHGIIDLEWHGWFHRQSSRILYSDIQGVSTEIVGVIGTVMRYGTLTVEKISTGSTVSLTEVPRPRSVESMILKNMETYLHSKNLKNAKHIEELLSTLVAEHMQEQTFTPKSSKKDEPRKGGFFSSRLGSKK